MKEKEKERDMTEHDDDDDDDDDDAIRPNKQNIPLETNQYWIDHFRFNGRTRAEYLIRECV